MFIHDFNILEQTKRHFRLSLCKVKNLFILHNIKIGLNNLGAPHEPIPLDKKLAWVFYKCTHAVFQQ